MINHLAIRSSEFRKYVIYFDYIVFFSAAVGVGFYGNEDAHKGVSQFAKAGTDADNTIHTMKTQVRNPHIVPAKLMSWTAVCTSSCVHQIHSGSWTLVTV